MVRRTFLGIGVALVLWQAVYSLEAPYLISASAMSDSSVVLKWRNNDIASLGYIIQRKDSGATAYLTIDTVKVAATDSLLDMHNLISLKTYVYQVFAYNATETSSVSNSLQVTTLSVVKKMVKSPISCFWDYDTSKSVRIGFYDSSNCETGYIINRKEEFSSTFTPISLITSSNPKSKGPISWTDTTADTGKWYTYYYTVFSNNDTLRSDTVTVYTYHVKPQLDKIYKFNKRSEFPIKLYSLSARNGDSIILKETSSPTGKFSVINVADPGKPVFEGYKDSVDLLLYPWMSLIPAYLRLGVYNYYYRQNDNGMNHFFYISSNIAYWKNDIYYIGSGVAANSKILKRFRLKDSSDAGLDTLYQSGYPSGYALDGGLLSLSANENIFEFQVFGFDAGSLSPVIQLNSRLISFSDSGLNKILKSSSSPCGFGPGGTWNETRTYKHGLVENKIVESSLWESFHSGDFKNFSISAIDTSTYRNTKINCQRSIDSTFNTGIYFSDNFNVCLEWSHFAYNYAYSTGPTKLYVVDKTNFDSRRILEQNNAVYIDTVNKLVSLRNILPDTANKRIYLIYTNAIVCLSYDTVAPVRAIAKNQLQKRADIFIKQTPRGIMILLPDFSKNTDIRFYDYSGRMVDRMFNVSSNAVLWMPKRISLQGVVMEIRSGKNKYVRNVIVR